MKKILAAILAMAVSSAWAAQGPGNQEQMVEQVLTVTGLNKSLKRLPVQLGMGFARAAMRMGASEEAEKELVKALQQALPEDAFVNHVSSALKKNYDEQRYAHLVAMLSTPVAARVTALEGTEPKPEDARQFFAGVAKNPLPPARLDLIRRIDAASHAGEMVTQMTIASFEASALAGGDECRNVLIKIRKAIAKNRAQLDKVNHDNVQMLLAFTYRDVSDADLDTYAKIYEDKDSRWVQGIILTAIEEQFKTSIEGAARGMKKIVAEARRHRTMFAPKCGESETPTAEDREAADRQNDQPVAEKPVAPKAQTQQPVEPAKAAVAPATPAVATATTPAVAAAAEQHPNAPAAAPVAVPTSASPVTRKTAAHKVRHRARRDVDLRACLDLPTTAEIIRCTEK